MNKKLQLLIVFLVLGIYTSTFAQVIQSRFINYQGVASNTSGEVIANETITVGIALKFGAGNVAASYAENHSITTDVNGVFSLQIGNGTPTIGDYNNYNWHSGFATFVTVSINGTEIGTSELLAVPYAIKAGNSGAEKIDDLEDAKSDSDGLSIFLGVGAGTSGAGIGNVGVGHLALSNNTVGIQNTASGFLAMESNTTGSWNIANGVEALKSNTIGGSNTASGSFALSSNTTGNWNTANGSSALLRNTEGENNTANGVRALFSNTIGNNNTANGVEALFANTIGEFNTATGRSALYNNIDGHLNTATGTNALRDNTTGNNNTANGVSALLNNTIGTFNTANGVGALRSNTTGSFNTVNGGSALLSNTTGTNNAANGVAALRDNTTGSFNTATGNEALYTNTTGGLNTAVGNLALRNNISGSNNTAVGYRALIDITSGNNNTAIGYDANVPNASGSNQVRIGNTQITYAGVQVAWTITSDATWKNDIQPLAYGLNLVTQLKPVDYLRKNNEENTREIGFIAQDVELLLNKLGYTNTGMLTTDDEGRLSLRYNDFIPVLTKAVQELNDKTTDLETMNKELLKRIETLEKNKTK